MSAVTSRQVEVNAAKGEQLTLGDLKEYVQAMGRAGAADSTPVSGRVSMGGKLRSLSARAVRFGDGGAGQ